MNINAHLPLYREGTEEDGDWMCGCGEYIDAGDASSEDAMMMWRDHVGLEDEDSVEEKRVYDESRYEFAAGSDIHGVMAGPPGMQGKTIPLKVYDDFIESLTLTKRDDIDPKSLGMFEFLTAVVLHPGHLPHDATGQITAMADGDYPSHLGKWEVNMRLWIHGTI